LNSQRFLLGPDPDHPGWDQWRVTDETGYNHTVIGPLLIRKETESTCRVRMQIEQRHTNAGGAIHGGTTLGFADVAMFCGFYVLTGIDPMGSSTVDLTAQFVGAGKSDQPLDAVVELLRETRRLGFLRGKMVQGSRTVAAFSATIRKPAS